MKITDPLDKILDNEAKVRILRFLIRTDAQWNGRQIAREVGVTPATAHKALQGLHREGVLLLQNAGKTHLYSLNSGNYVVSDLLRPLFNREDKVLSGIVSIIKKSIISSAIKNNIISVVLFGSVNLRKDSPESDIDLAVIAGDRESLRKIESLFEGIDKKISAEFGNTVSTYFNTAAEFKAKREKGLDIIKNILKSNTLIYGKEIEGVL
ncbi:MAG: helix-turn-helix domain-containing protein [Candidatus Omnitrophota bacterium]|nr:helix-turn-helix domain-containing protein [Candidatus Omnitrophota bacterium]